MKRFASKALNAIFLLAGLFLVLAGCANPLGFSPEDEAVPSQDGTLTVKFALSSDSDSSSASRAVGIRPTVYPQGDPDFFKPDYYVITAIDPNGGWRNFGNVQPNQAAQGISGFFEGYWFIDVKAYVDQASEDLLLAAGSTTATIYADRSNSVSVKLNSRIDTDQFGYLQYSLTVNSPLANPNLSLRIHRLKPLDASTTSINFPTASFTTAADRVWISPSLYDFKAGMYRVDSVLQDGSAVVWGESQIVYVFPGLTSPYNREVTVTELGELPRFSPFVSLNNGIVVDNEGEGTAVTISSLDPGAIIVYTLDPNPATTLGYDFLTGQPNPGCQTYSGPLTLDSTFDGMDGMTDSVTNIRAAACNPVGSGPESSRIYYYSDAIYVAKTTPEAVGTALWPLTDLQAALDRARDLNRSMVTDVRVTVGGYTPSAASGEFTQYGGTRLSGSYVTGSPWQRSATLPSPIAYNDINATMLIGNASGGADESLTTASFRIVENLGKPAYCEYFGIQSGTSAFMGTHHAALLADSISAALAIEHIQVTGGMGSSFYNSYGIFARSSSSVTLSDCHVTGREGGGANLNYSTTALQVLDTNLTVTSSTLNAGNGFESGYNQGVHASGSSVLSMNGSLGPNYVNGAILANPGTSNNFGVRISGGSTANLSEVTVNCASGASICGVAFLKSSGNVSQSNISISASTAHTNAIALYLEADPNPYSGPAAPADFTVSESIIEENSSYSATSLSAGIQLAGGKAFIMDNSLVSGGLAANASGNSYGIELSPVAPAWAEAEILRNSAIVGKTAYVSAGIHATNQIRLLAERNDSIRSDSIGGSGTSSKRASMYLTGIRKITGRDGHPMVNITDNKGMFSTVQATTSGYLFGLYVDADSLGEAIVVERNRVSAGDGPSNFSSPSGGAYVSLTGTRKAPFVFRNNIVYGGTATVPMAKGMYISCDIPGSGDARIILANNTIISSMGSGAALFLSGYAKPELYNNTFFKQSGSAGRSVEAEINAAPVSMQFCAFANINPTSTYWYDGGYIDPTSNNGLIQENIVHVFGSLGDLFQAPFMYIADFSVFKAEYRTDADEKDRFGGLTLAGTGGPVAPWPFREDCFNNQRDPGYWSRGANQPIHP